MSRWTDCLQGLMAKLPAKHLGWPEHNEVFVRGTILATKWFKLYLHKVNCPAEPPDCHDHPWHFWTLILAGGYKERACGKVRYRSPGTLLYRPARFLHSVWTKGDAWSIVLVSSKVRPWGFKACKA